MKITFLGHAGLFVETKSGTVLCDPWFNPAFQQAWYPFPANDGLPTDQISTPDFLFISHPHQDHLDRKFLRERVSKTAWVILPDSHYLRYATNSLIAGSADLSKPKNGEPVIIDGLRMIVEAVVSPADGPIGDSALLLGDVKQLSSIRTIAISAVWRGLNRWGRWTVTSCNFQEPSGIPPFTTFLRK